MTVNDIVLFLEKRGFLIDKEIREGKKNITGFSSLMNYKPNTVTWVKSQKNVENCDMSNKALIIAEKGCEILSNNILYCKNSRACFFFLLQELWGTVKKEGIEDTALIETSDIGEHVYIGNYTYVNKNVKIGNGVIIENNVQILCQCEIGNNCHIWPGVVIGTDGFGYYDKDDGTYGKIPHFGGVFIGSDVEIGSNTCIDRGTLDHTIICDGVKIDNLCHIGHNVKIGKNSLVIAQSMLGGSCEIGDYGYVAPGVNIKDHIRMKENSMAGMGAVVTRDIPENEIFAGVPARYLKKRDIKH